MDTEYYFFPTWKPNVWISFCSIYNWDSKMLKVNVNNQLAFQINNLQTETKYSNSNVILLNAYSYASNAYIYPFDGSVTDVNIWSRAFSDEESEKWSKCNFDKEGTVLDWNKAKFKIHGNIDVEEIDQADACHQPVIEKFLAFPEKLNFIQSVKFCEKIGGKIAVAENFENLEKIQEALKELQESGECSSLFYTGYWFKDGQWKHFLTDEPLQLAEFGVEATYSSCATIDKVFTKEEGKFKRDQCNTKTCPVCYINDWPSVLKLRGVKKVDNLDSFYYLLNHTHILGSSKSRLVLGNEKWNMQRRNGEILGWTEKANLPLGKHEWDLLGSRTNMSLQDAVEEPGNFCCDDGGCISSELVCDNRKHCEDNSDEQKCPKLFMNTNYDPSSPPETIINDGISTQYEKSDIFTEIQILDVTDISQVTGTFTVFIHLEMSWFDSNLKFVYLKNDQYKNLINESIVSDIWTPKFDFAFLDTKETIFQSILVRKENEAALSADIEELHPLGKILMSINQYYLKVHKKNKINIIFYSNRAF